MNENQNKIPIIINDLVIHEDLCNSNCEYCLSAPYTCSYPRYGRPRGTVSGGFLSQPYAQPSLHSEVFRLLRPAGLYSGQPCLQKGP